MPKTLSILGAVIVISSVLAAAAAWASVDGDTIHACASQRNGVLRQVASADDCTTRETPVDWSIEGPAGPAGAGSQPISSLMLPGESTSWTFGSFTIAATCTSEGGFELEVLGPEMWFDGSGTSDPVSGPMKLATVAAPPLNPPTSGTTVDEGGLYYAMTNDLEIFHFERFIVALTAPNGVDRECRFGGLVASS